MGRKVQVCSKCGGPRAGHSIPLGKNCKETPLDKAQREAVINQIVQEGNEIEEVEITSDDGKEGEPSTLPDKEETIAEN